MANFHLFASAPAQITTNVFHEFDPVYPYDQLLTHPPEIRDGKAILPDRPGLGTDLLDGLEERFPFGGGTWFIHKEERLRKAVA
jgi:L-alanine-DL-glutamate epimerase-like enolase superfamily enzyme